MTTGTDRLRVASVSRVYPTPDDVTYGLFVAQRLEAMAANMDLTVIQPLPYFPIVKPLPGWSDDNGTVERIPMFYIPAVLKRLDSRWLERAVFPRIRDLHERKPLDAIDAHFGYPDGVGCLRAGKRLGVPTFVTIRGEETEQLHRRAIRRQLRQTLNSVDGCICVSHFLKEQMLVHGADPLRTSVIQNGVDRQLFRPGDTRQTRKRLGWDADRVVIVSVGHLVERKQHHVLIEAFALVRRRFPDAVLAIIGSRKRDPLYAAALSSRVRRLRLQESVRFFGAMPHSSVAECLRAADLFSLLSSREGCCNALLEALASGLPAVVTDVGDNRHFVKDRVTGALCAPADAEGAASGLTSLLSAGLPEKPVVSRSLDVSSWDEVGARVERFMRRKLRLGRGISR